MMKGAHTRFCYQLGATKLTSSCATEIRKTTRKNELCGVFPPTPEDVAAYTICQPVHVFSRAQTRAQQDEHTQTNRAMSHVSADSVRNSNMVMSENNKRAYRSLNLFPQETTQAFEAEVRFPDDLSKETDCYIPLIVASEKHKKVEFVLMMCDNGAVNVSEMTTLYSRVAAKFKDSPATDLCPTLANTLSCEQVFPTTVRHLISDPENSGPVQSAWRRFAMEAHTFKSVQNEIDDLVSDVESATRNPKLKPLFAAFAFPTEGHFVGFRVERNPEVVSAIRAAKEKELKEKERKQKARSAGAKLFPSHPRRENMAWGEYLTAGAVYDPSVESDDDESSDAASSDSTGAQPFNISARIGDQGKELTLEGPRMSAAGQASIQVRFSLASKKVLQKTSNANISKIVGAKTAAVSASVHYLETIASLCFADRRLCDVLQTGDYNQIMCTRSPTSKATWVFLRKSEDGDVFLWGLYQPVTLAPLTPRELFSRLAPTSHIPGRGPVTSKRNHETQEVHGENGKKRRKRSSNSGTDERCAKRTNGHASASSGVLLKPKLPETKLEQQIRERNARLFSLPATNPDVAAWDSSGKYLCIRNVKRAFEISGHGKTCGGSWRAVLRDRYGLDRLEGDRDVALRKEHVAKLVVSHREFRRKK